MQRRSVGAQGFVSMVRPDFLEHEAVVEYKVMHLSNI